MPYISSFLVFLFFLPLLQAQHSCPSCQGRKQALFQARETWKTSSAQPAINNNTRSDSFDILHYHLDIDMRQAGNRFLAARADIRFVALQSNLQSLPLDLLQMQVDSVLYGGSALAYSYNDTLLQVQFVGALIQGDTQAISVYYQGSPQRDASWGGFYFDGNYAFNLGVGFSADPHNYGRVWHPCFDNFVERATYSFRVRTAANMRPQCNGILLSSRDTAGYRISDWEMNTPIPTYLACIASAPYSVVSYELAGAQSPVPVALAALPSDTTPLKQAFQRLGSALDAFEYWFGPHRWDKIGYSLVPFNAGAMEHATNIAYPRVAIGANSIESLMAHELAHSWWGNWTTCESSEDMWINEGMASYCAHLFYEEAYGPERYKREVKTNFYNVLRQAHVQEGGYRAVSGVPHEYTYGRHVYDKGASVAHNLRYYLGDSLFRLGMTQILDSFALRSINSNELRNALLAYTGDNKLPAFFDDWVFSGGYPHFEIENYSISAQAGQYQVDIHILQKLIGRSQFFRDVPLRVSAYSSTGQRMEQSFVVSGERQNLAWTLPFEPSLFIINEGHGLLQARYDDDIVIEQLGIRNLPTVSIDNIQLTSLPPEDSLRVHLSHHPVAPSADPQAEYLISAHRFWTVSGLWNPMSFDARIRFETSASLDSNLWARGSDSLILLYRPNPNAAWAEHPDYNRQDFPGLFFLRANLLLPGQYAIGYGEARLALEGRKKPAIELKVYPNPTQGLVELAWKHRFGKNNTRLEVYDSQGRMVLERNLGQLASGPQQQQIDTSGWAQGLYFIKLRQEGRRDIVGTAKLSVQ